MPDVKYVYFFCCSGLHMAVWVRLQDESRFLLNYSPTLPRVGVRVRVRVNPHPREGWVTSLPETGINTDSLPLHLVVQIEQKEQLVQALSILFAAFSPRHKFVRDTRQTLIVVVGKHFLKEV